MYVIREIKDIRNTYKVCRILILSGVCVIILFFIILTLKFEGVII